MIAQELIHKIRKQKGKNGLMLLKIDLQKAYDRVEWSFLDKTMGCLRFSQQVRSFVINCVGSVQYRLVLNGNIWGFINPSRGLRQGEPLSPFLFVLTAKVLSRLIVREEDAGRIQGVKVSRTAPTISHLIYADDLMITCRANENNARAMKVCLDTYFVWSRQEANLGKSRILFSKNLCGKVKKRIKSHFGFK